MAAAAPAGLSDLQSALLRGKIRSFQHRAAQPFHLLLTEPGKPCWGRASSPEGGWSRFGVNLELPSERAKISRARASPEVQNIPALVIR